MCITLIYHKWHHTSELRNGTRLAKFSGNVEDKQGHNEEYDRPHHKAVVLESTISSPHEGRDGRPNDFQVHDEKNEKKKKKLSPFDTHYPYPTEIGKYLLEKCKDSIVNMI
jgi:hypothetical protein